MAPLDLGFFSNIEDKTEFKKIITFLNTCDYVFLNGYAIRFSSYLTSKYFIFFTGSDLTFLADSKHSARQGQVFYGPNNRAGSTDR